ncbi:MAG: hypothetical protein HQL67_12365 [Magnetococcales bacterium]|nr:hypothetical protein [Magnetococcales bacterium]
MYKAENGDEAEEGDEDENQFNLEHFELYEKFISKNIADIEYFVTWDRDLRRCDEAVSKNINWLQQIEQTVKNCNSNLKPIPVIHHPDYYGKNGVITTTEPSFYLEKKYPFIACAIGEDKKGIPTHFNTDWVYLMINNSGLKCHEMGCASEDKLKRLPIHSSDATTWKQDVFRSCSIKFVSDKNINKVLKIPVHKRIVDVKNAKYFDGTPKKIIDAFTKYLDEVFGFSLDDFLIYEDFDDEDTKKLKRINQHIISMYYYINVLPRRINQFHRANGWDTRWPEEIPQVKSEE